MFYVDQRIAFECDSKLLNFDALSLMNQNNNLYDYCFNRRGSRIGRDNVSCMCLYGYSMRKNNEIIEREVGVVTCLGIGFTVYSDVSSFEDLQNGEDEVIRKVVQPDGFLVNDDGTMGGFLNTTLVRKVKMAPSVINQYYDGDHSTMAEFVGKSNGRFLCTKCQKEFVDTKCYVCKDRLCGNCHIINSYDNCGICDKKLVGEVLCVVCHGVYCIKCHQNLKNKCDPLMTQSTIKRSAVLDLSKLQTLNDRDNLFVKKSNVNFSYTTAVVPQKLPWVSIPIEEYIVENHTVSIY